MTDAVPFVSPDWLLPWWRQFGTGQTRVATLWRGNQLTGVLPLYILPSAGRLLPMGVSISDYLDVLVDPGETPDAASELLACALSGANGCDCDIMELPPSARLLDASVRNLTAQIAHGALCPVLAGEIPSRQRRKVRMASHRAARHCEARVERAAASTVSPALEALFALHARRWGAGVIADKRVQAFLCEATPLLLDAGLRALACESIVLYGDGRHVRDTLRVEDATSAYIAARDRIEAISGSAFNLGGGPATLYACSR